MRAKNAGYFKGRADDQPQKGQSYVARDSDLITLLVLLQCRSDFEIRLHSAAVTLDARSSELYSIY